jgi:hypothetical protein
MTNGEVAYQEKLIKAFTPNRPIDLPEFLSGRSEILFKTLDAARTPGLHTILFGDRGTGKTSVEKVLGYILQEVDKERGCRSLFVQCNSMDNYTTIWQKIIQEIMIRQPQFGFHQQTSAVIRGKPSFDSSVADPNDARLVVGSISNPLVIIIDEFDRIPAQSNARPLMADTIKLFADANVDCKLIIVGVAESVTELIAEHQSIARNMRQIMVAPMTIQELAEIIQKGYKYVGLQYETGLDTKIARLSQGYPHYTHLLGLWAGRRALQRGVTTVSDIDLNNAIPDALENTIESVRQEYELAISSSKKNSLYKQVLLACAVANKDTLGRFSLTDVRRPLCDITGRDYGTGAYQSHLAEFCKPYRGQILKRTGLRKNYRWKFVNPQLITYVRLQGATARLI